MLNVRATIEGNTAAYEFLGEAAAESPEAVKRGLRTAARGVYAEAMKNLNGPGRTAVRVRGKNKTRARGQYSFLGARPGSYPVPRLTSNLIRLLGILEPGESKKGDAVTFSAGEMEFVVYDSAAYAVPIHEGEGTSRKHGPRRYMIDGLNTYDDTVGLATPVEEELNKMLNK